MESLLIILALLLRIFSNPLSNAFQKKLTLKGHHPILVIFLSYFLLSLGCIWPALDVAWAELPAQFWYYSVLAGLAGAMGNGFLVKALQQGELSVLGPINSYKAVVGIVFAIFLLGEIPNLFGLLGVALIIYGSYFVLGTTKEGFSWALLKRKDIQFRFLARFLTAIEAVFIKKIILASSVLISFISWCGFGFLFSFLLLFIFSSGLRAEMQKLELKDLGSYAGLILCLGTMQYTTNYVFSNMDVGYALSLFQLSSIVSIILGYRIFREEGIGVKVLGSAIMIAGSVLIILLNS